MKGKNYDAIVVGSGVGGLATAIALGENGYKVLVLEQHYVPGGWSHSFTLKGQRFSPGVHYIGQVGQGETTNQLYCDLGIANELSFFRMNPNGFEHAIIGDEQFDFPAGLENIINAFVARFPDEASGIEKYLRLIETVNYQIQLMSTFKTTFAKITAPFKTKYVGKYGLFSVDRVLNWHLKQPLLQAFLNVQCGDHGLPPKKASFPVHAAMMSHYLNGGYYPYGGGGAIVKSMTNRVKKWGGDVRVKQNVDKIIVNDQKVAKGVSLDSGEQLFANIIVSNTDPHKTYMDLVGKEYLSRKLIKKLDKTRYSLTSFILFLTLKADLKEIDSGNYWLIKNKDLSSHFEELTTKDARIGKKFPVAFMSCTTRKDPASFDGTHHNFEVLTYVDYKCIEQFEKEGEYHTEEYATFKEIITKKLLTNVQEVIPNVFDCVVTAELGSPLTNNYYIQSTKGNVYGTEKSLKHVGPLAFKNKSEISNLFLTGSSTLSHGVSGATSSGINAAANILKLHPDEVLSNKTDQFLDVFEAEDESTWPEWVWQKRETKARRVQTKSVKEES